MDQAQELELDKAVELVQDMVEELAHIFVELDLIELVQVQDTAEEQEQGMVEAQVVGQEYK